MGALRSCEMSVNFYPITRRHLAGDSILERPTHRGSLSTCVRVHPALRGCPPWGYIRQIRPTRAVQHTEITITAIERV
jgi:hypothetical protein